MHRSGLLRGPNGPPVLGLGLDWAPGGTSGPAQPNAEV